MIKRHKRKPDNRRFYRINERIYSSTLRVLGQDGKQIGILSKFEALRKAREFLEAGNKVKFVVKFAGRQITHPEFGDKVLQKAIDELSDISKIEREKHFEGRALIAIISPDKKGSKTKLKESETKEASSDTKALGDKNNAKEESKKISQ